LGLIPNQAQFLSALSHSRNGIVREEVTSGEVEGGTLLPLLEDSPTVQNSIVSEYRAGSGGRLSAVLQIRFSGTASAATVEYLSKLFSFGLVALEKDHERKREEVEDAGDGVGR
jgi:hypothetical protein